VIAALSVTSDLTRGHPPGEAMRACLLSSELACRAGLDPVRQGEVFYASLMLFAGCAATSHEAAGAFGGDDVAVRSRGDLIDPTRPVEALDPDDVWAAFVDTEPQPRRLFRDEDHLDEALAGFGDAADLKTPYFQGHSRGVALLARASTTYDMTVDPALLYRAGLVHDLGRVAVPTGV